MGHSSGVCDTVSRFKTAENLGEQVLDTHRVWAHNRFPQNSFHGHPQDSSTLPRIVSRRELSVRTAELKSRCFLKLGVSGNAARLSAGNSSPPRLELSSTNRLLALISG